MNRKTRIILTGAATVAILAGGTAGVAAMASSLSPTDQSGTAQSITPVVSGTASTAAATPAPTPSSSTPWNSNGYTVDPANPFYITILPDGSMVTTDSSGKVLSDDEEKSHFLPDDDPRNGGLVDDSGHHGGGTDDVSGHH
jgi:hypothetical protein